MHELLCSFYKGQASKQELVNAYLVGFRSHVLGNAPNSDIYINYFNQGLSYLKELSIPNGKTLGVEQRVSFELGGYPFIGYIDRLYIEPNNNGIVVQDHKSRALKPRSTRGKVTKSDEELERYLRQLYIYSIPVELQYGALPSYLEFNCYRTKTLIREPFSKTTYEESKVWALQSIENIIRADDFRPSIDYYFCNHICDVHDSCEYYEMEFCPKRRFYRV